MAVTHTTEIQGAVSARRIFGRYKDTAAIAANVEISLGFQPKYIRWVNETNVTMFEWHVGLGANKCIKTAANGARTLESVGFTVSEDGFEVDDDGTLDAIAQNDQIAYYAEG